MTEAAANLAVWERRSPIMAVEMAALGDVYQAMGQFKKAANSSSTSHGWTG
ncbi:MAG: hypothetical protein AABZ34_18880 [Nitrospirota bacterium]